jgi:hypothetical protein
MSKATVTRFFIGGVLAVLTGAIVAVAAVWVAIANDVFVMDGPNLVGITGGTLGIALGGLGIVGATAMLAGFVAGLVAWVGALLNTAQIANKAWFIVLLVTGIFSLGFIAMIAYVVAGPDGTTDSKADRHHDPSLLQSTP